MPFLAIPAVLAATIGAGGAVAGGLIGKSGAKGEQGIQQEELNAANQTQTEKLNLINENEPTLNQYTGPADKSPFYQSLYAKGVEGTNQAYNNARESAANSARTAGFGYESPNVQGSGAELKAAEAGSLARVPGEALTQAIQPGLEATQIRSGEAGTLSPQYSAVNQITGQIAGQEQALGQGVGAAAAQLAGQIPTGRQTPTPAADNPYLSQVSTLPSGISLSGAYDLMNPENYVNQSYGGSPFNPAWGG